jgi:nitroreductase
MSLTSILKEGSLLDQLNLRYATKSFDRAKKIDSAKWSALEEVLRLSPSSFGLQPWGFFVVKNESLRSELKTVSWNQSQITDASHLVVFAIKTKIDNDYIESFISDLANKRGQSLESLKMYKDMMIGYILSRSPEQIREWATHQVYIALGFFLSSAAMLGIDACPMEGFEPESYDRILKLPEQGFKSVVLATAGYRSTDDRYANAAKVRYNYENVIKSID